MLKDNIRSLSPRKSKVMLNPSMQLRNARLELLERSPTQMPKKRAKSAGKKSPGKVRTSTSSWPSKEQIKMDKTIAKKLLKAELVIDKPKKLKLSTALNSRPATTHEKKQSKSALKNPTLRLLQEQRRPLNLDIPPLKPRMQNNDFFTKIATKENYD